MGLRSQEPVKRDGYSWRLVLFAPGTDPARRCRRMTFLAVYGLVVALVTWPLYSLFASPAPLILGLPMSLAWIILALTVMFCALLWLFRSETDRGGPPEAG